MEMVKNIDWIHFIYALVLVILGFFIARQISLITNKALEKHVSRHQSLLAKRLIFYGLFLIFIISGLQQIGFRMTVLLSAAGIFTVALSFASQTAASNLVSGIFLLFESPFKVGDNIKIKEIIGIVDSIDLLSTKIKTPENMLIRIPNEIIIKSDIMNMSFYNIHRLDILVRITPTSDIRHAKKVLCSLASSHAGILKMPTPQVNVEQLDEKAIILKLIVSVKAEEITTIKNDLYEVIQNCYDANELRMP